MEKSRNKLIWIIVILAAAALLLLFLMFALEKDQNICSTCDGGSVTSGDGYVTIGEYTDSEYGSDTDAWARKCYYKCHAGKAASLTIDVEQLNKDGGWDVIDTTGWNLSGSGDGTFYIDYMASKRGGSISQSRSASGTELKGISTSGLSLAGYGSISGTNVLGTGHKAALAVFMLENKGENLGLIDDPVSAYENPQKLKEYQKVIAVTLKLNREKHY